MSNSDQKQESEMKNMNEIGRVDVTDELIGTYNFIKTLEKKSYSEECPLCQTNGPIFNFTCKIMRRNILKHMEQNILAEYHAEDLNDYFESICKDLVNVETWVKQFGVPNVKLRLREVILFMDPKVLPYLLSEGYDINNIIDEIEPSIEVKGVSKTVNIILKTLIRYNYAPSKYAEAEEISSRFIDYVTEINNFKRCIELYNFDIADAKKYIDNHIQFAIRQNINYQYCIKYLIDTFDLRDYVRNHELIRKFMIFATNTQII